MIWRSGSILTHTRPRICSKRCSATCHSPALAHAFLKLCPGDTNDRQTRIYPSYLWEIWATPWRRRVAMLGIPNSKFGWGRICAKAQLAKNYSIKDQTHRKTFHPQPPHTSTRSKSVPRFIDALKLTVSGDIRRIRGSGGSCRRCNARGQEVEVKMVL